MNLKNRNFFSFFDSIHYEIESKKEKKRGFVVTDKLRF